MKQVDASLYNLDDSTQHTDLSRDAQFICIG